MRLRSVDFWFSANAWVVIAQPIEMSLAVGVAQYGRAAAIAGALRSAI